MKCLSVCIAFFRPINWIEIMKNTSSLTLFFVLVVAAAGCASNSNLRKFSEDNIDQEISAEMAKKFEVKDLSEGTTAAPDKGAKVVSQEKSKKKKKKISKKMKKSEKPFVFPVRRPEKVPFNVGEKLEYGIRFVGVPAGSLRLEVLPFKTVNERKVFHIHGHAKTAALFELVYRVNDQVDSYWDYDGIFSHRFTMDLDESKQSRKVIELYDYEKLKSFYWNRIDHVDKGFSEQKEEHDIALWGQDPLAALYYLRVAPLPKEKDKLFKFPTFLDGKLWWTHLKYQGQEKIYAGGRYFEAHTYSLENYQNGELKNKDNTVWISADEHKYILRVEAKIKVGSFAVALEEIL